VVRHRSRQEDRGYNAADLIELVFEPLLEKYGKDMPELDVFDASGDVIADIPVESGTKTYDLAVRILNGEGVEDLVKE
jgi:hypothetical protein